MYSLSFEVLYCGYLLVLRVSVLVMFPVLPRSIHVDARENLRPPRVNGRENLRSHRVNARDNLRSQCGNGQPYASTLDTWATALIFVFGIRRRPPCSMIGQPHAQPRDNFRSHRVDGSRTRRRGLVPPHSPPGYPRDAVGCRGIPWDTAWTPVGCRVGYVVSPARDAAWATTWDTVDTEWYTAWDHTG